jgi:hypothetical protein
VLIASDAGALALGATDRAIRMLDQFASCFHDERYPQWIEHEVATLIGQRVFGIAQASVAAMPKNWNSNCAGLPYGFTRAQRSGMPTPPAGRWRSARAMPALA